MLQASKMVGRSVASGSTPCLRGRVLWGFWGLVGSVALVGVPGSGHTPAVQRDLANLFVWKSALRYQDRGLTGRSTAAVPQGNLTEVLQQAGEVLPREAFFWGMNVVHMKVVSALKSLLMEESTAEASIALAATLRDRPEVNVKAWINAVAAAVAHHPPLQGLSIPSVVEIMPGNFFSDSILAELKKLPKNATREGQCAARVNGEVGRDNGVENKLWYFREDVLLNSHHWYWHLAYPLNSPRGTLDRKGELFYYMHHSILARFHTERLLQGMKPIKPFTGAQGTHIRWGYHPHLSDANSGANWTSRPARMPVVDISNGRLVGTPAVIQLEERTAFIATVVKALERGEVVPGEHLGLGRGPLSLKNDEGINILGNIIEANGDSLNPALYYEFGIHNSGHNIISLIMDPQETLGLPPGPMGEASTAMRDSMFYRHHYFIDQLFGKHKKTLAPYQLRTGNWPLLLPGVKMTGFRVVSAAQPGTVNRLHTFWGSRRFDLSGGLDFNRTEVAGPLVVCMEHLDHHSFTYQFEIERTTDADADFEGEVTVRIFLGPVYDLQKNPFTLETVRDLTFVLDTFTVNIGPSPGISHHHRSSLDTPLTLSFPQSLRELQSSPGATSRRPFCGCGWPHHLLLPKGLPSGYPMALFALLTNAADDQVPSPEEDPPCQNSYIFCGLWNAQYPDRRPMGYPFDRPIHLNTTYLQDVPATVPNSAFTPITIYHLGSE